MVFIILMLPITPISLSIVHVSLLIFASTFALSASNAAISSNRQSPTLQNANFGLKRPVSEAFACLAHLVLWFIAAINRFARFLRSIGVGAR